MTIICTTDEEIAAALRKARADGMRMAAEMLAQKWGAWTDMPQRLRSQADEIERGEAA